MGGADTALYIVDLKQSAVDCTGLECIDPSRSTAQITFSGADAAVFATDEGAEQQLSQTYDRAAVIISFEQLGGAEVALHMAREHSLQRYAFGRQIGSYQAIRNKLVGMYADISLARGNCYYGAWAASADDPELPLAAATARISAAKAYYHAAKENIQIHGGMGCTWEMDCHFYYRRAKWLGSLIGGDRYWKSRIVDQLDASVAT